MARRALVIGSQVGSLQGVHNDVAAISHFPRALDFAVDARIEQDASYIGITEGYKRLIAGHGPDDTAIIYYAGHGGLAPGLDGTGRLQFLVPTDCETVEGEFRGLFAFELSVLLAELTAKGRNVAVILDCCHAATMSREVNPSRKADLVPRALPRVIVEGVAERLKSLAPMLAQVPPEGNRDAVRLVATEASLSAYEGLDERGQPGGIMTGAALRMTAAPVARVRDGRNVSPEGPRLLASEVERDLNWSAFVAFGAPDPFN
jgi:hypothetical protein